VGTSALSSVPFELVGSPIQLAASPDKNKSESTEAEVSLSISEGDDLDDMSSLGGGGGDAGSVGDGVGYRKRKVRRGGREGVAAGHLPPKGNMHTLNKLKAEIAMLQEALHAAEATDKTLLQGRLREYRYDSVCYEYSVINNGL
jgi:hypothetical protein